MMAQPAYIRAINRLGRLLQDRGLSLPRLDADRLCTGAMRQAGVEDFGDPSYLPALRFLTGQLNEHADLSQVGRFAAHFNLGELLRVRLQLVQYRKQRPEVAQQRVERPLIIVGLPRTGTTILFELIAQDPDMRYPASWEVARPMPPPQSSSYASDPRIAQVGRVLAWLERLAPGFRVIHPIGASLPQECVYMQASSFLSDQFGYMYDIPQYRDWLLQQDMAASFRWHKHFLQHLQVDCPGQRWVLKTPAHLGHLDHLTECYPDAAIVWTHRRPLDAVSSFCSLTTTLRAGFSDAIDPLASGRDELEHSANVVRAGLSARADLPPRQIYDAAFGDICRDPVAVVHDIYRHFGWSLAEAAEQRMRAYLQNHPRNLYGEHHYTPAQFGLDGYSEREVFGDYLDTYASVLL